MSKHKGYISLYRDIQDHWLWDDKPYARGQAFIDLLLKANHEPRQVIFNEQTLDIGRGEFVTSIAKLSEAWGWSRHKTKDFLDGLQKDHIITLKSDNKKTAIKVLKYDVYQLSKKAQGHQKDIKRTSKRTQTINSISKEILLENKKTKVSGDPKGHTDF